MRGGVTMALIRTGGKGSALDVTGFVELTEPITNATNYQLILVSASGNSGGAITGLTISITDPSTNKFLTPKIGSGVGAGASMLYVPTIDDPTITVTATQQQGYTSNTAYKVYGLPK